MLELNNCFASCVWFTFISHFWFNSSSCLKAFLMHFILNLNELVSPFIVLVSSFALIVWSECWELRACAYTCDTVNLKQGTKSWNIMQHLCSAVTCQKLVSRGGARGLPRGATGPPSGPPKFSAWRHVTALKSYTDHWKLPLLQNWPHQWPPQMKMSGSAPACEVVNSRVMKCQDRALVFIRDSCNIDHSKYQCRGKAAPYPPVGEPWPFVGAPQYILY